MPGSSAVLLESSTPLPRLSTPPFLYISDVHMSGSSALSTSSMSVFGFTAPPSLSSCLLVPRLFVPFVSNAPVPGSSTPLSLSGRLLVPGLSIPSASGVLMPGSSALPSLSGCLLMSRSSTLSASGMPISESSALLSLFGHLPMPGSSALSPSSCLFVPGLSLPGSSPPFLIWLSPQTSMPILEKQRLGQWD